MSNKQYPKPLSEKALQKKYAELNPSDEKSGGEFFTPADVSELLTRLGTVGKTEINKVYEIPINYWIQSNVA